MHPYVIHLGQTLFFSWGASPPRPPEHIVSTVMRIHCIYSTHTRYPKYFSFEAYSESTDMFTRPLNFIARYTMQPYFILVFT